MDAPRLLRKKKARQRQRARAAKPRVEEENLHIAKPAPADEEPGQVTRLSWKGFDVWCDAVRWHGNMLVFLSVHGTQTAVRAFWANIVSGKHPSVQVGEQHLRLAETHYSTVRTLLRPQYLHFVTLHPSATNSVSAFADSFYLIGENPHERFWTRFSRMCQVPMRQSWRDEVWILGLEKKLIAKLAGYGLDGYYVNTGEAWLEVIQEAVKAKRLV